MRTPFLRCSAIAFALALCGCGGDGASAPSGPSNPAGGGSTRSVTLHFCPNEVRWAAYQDDAGHWSGVSVAADGSANVTMTNRGTLATTHQIAYAQQPSAPPFTNVEFRTADEFAAEYTQCSPVFVAGPKSVSATITGLIAAERSAQVNIGGATAEWLSAPSGPLTVNNVDNRTLDLIAYTADCMCQSGTPMRFIVRRNVSLNSGDQVTFDFSSSEAISAASANITFTGVSAGDDVWIKGTLVTANGWAEVLKFRPVSATSLAYWGIPTSRMLSGDRYFFNVFNQPTASNPFLRGVVDSTLTLADRTIAFGPSLAMPTVTKIATSPLIRVHVQLPMQPEYSDEMSAAFGQTNSSVTMYESSGYLAGSGNTTTWDVTVPDLTAAPGFNSAWGLAPTASTFGRVLAGKRTSSGERYSQYGALLP